MNSCTDNCLINFKNLYFSPLNRVSLNDKEVKVNIFDMAGHPVFYEVHLMYIDVVLYIIIYCNKFCTLQLQYVHLIHFKPDSGEMQRDLTNSKPLFKQ